MATANQATPSAASSVLHARHLYLASGRVPTGVRGFVGESWLRSSKGGVDPAGLRTRFETREAADARVLRAVDVVLGHMASQLSNESISLIFAAPNGQVLRRLCTDNTLTRALGRVNLEPGFDYGEATVGTNGIGTALERDCATLIVGAEHFSEELTGFACAGAPIHHPVSGVTVGVVDLTCRAKSSNSLLLTYAQTIAEQIELEMFAEVGAQELALMRDYLAACRHATGPIVALNSDLVIMNHHAQQTLSSTDRSALLARTADAAGVLEPTTIVADLPSGSTARMDYRPTFHGEDLAGGVFRILVRHNAAPKPDASAVTRMPLRLTGLAGVSPEWRRACEQVRETRETFSWVVIDGENGVGKFSLARGMHYAFNPAGHLRVLDAALSIEDPEAWLQALESELESGPPGTLILRHIGMLTDELLGPVSEVLLEQAALSRANGHRWVVATRDSEVINQDVDTQIIPIFDRSITIEALRHRGDDIAEMVPVMLRQISRSSDLAISRRALSQLQRHPWPRNANQLIDVLRQVVQVKRRGVIELEDLPPECMSVGRRTLSSLESMERDAITMALRDCGDNKAKAAEKLGLSRATIYRKIREYKIVSER